MCATAPNRAGFLVSKMIHDSEQCSSDVTYCLPVRALLDVVVASCHWTTFPTSSSGTQPLHPKVYTNSPKNHLVLVVYVRLAPVGGTMFHGLPPAGQRAATAGTSKSMVVVLVGSSRVV